MRPETDGAGQAGLVPHWSERHQRLLICREHMLQLAQKRRRLKEQFMSSILTNNSAMVALQTLRSINKNLATTQTEISTGKTVASAKDNATV